MGLADALSMRGHNGQPQPAPLDVAVLEDDPELAALAVELCRKLGLVAIQYPSPGAFLATVGVRPPRLLILDWRFERELGSGAFLAVRHRFGALPIVCWTSTPLTDLPAMLAGDERVRIVPKSAGIRAFETAVGWAASQPRPDRPRTS